MVLTSLGGEYQGFALGIEFAIFFYSPGLLVVADEGIQASVEAICDRVMVLSDSLYQLQC